MMRKTLISACFALTALTSYCQIQTNGGVQYLMNGQKDMSTDFYDLSNTYFLADSLCSFDLQSGTGTLEWKRYRLSPRQAFNTNGYWPVPMRMLDFPETQYDNDPHLRLQLQFVSPRTVRITMLTRPDALRSAIHRPQLERQRQRSCHQLSKRVWHSRDSETPLAIGFKRQKR